MNKTILFIALFMATTQNYAQKIKNENKINTESDSIKNNHLLDEVSIPTVKKSSFDVYKSGIKTFDLPQATTTVGLTTFKNQQIQDFKDLLKNVNGLYIMGTTGGVQEEIASRGYSFSSSNNTFKNGVRYFNGANGTGMKTEMSGIESVEFLKGNSAILYGNVAPGGILNLVTKKPKFNFGGEVGLTYGSFNNIKPTFDIYGPLNDKIAYRLNTSFNKSESFRDYVESESFYINPSFLFKFAEHTKLIVEADFLKDKRTPDFGGGIINYKIADIPRSRFNGFSWGKNKAEQSSFTATFHHHFTDNLEITTISGYRNYKTDLHTNVRPNATGSLIKENGDWIRKTYKNQTEDSYFVQQVDLTAKISTGKIKHQILFGADYQTYQTKNTAFDNSKDYDENPINIFEKYDASKYESKGIVTPNKLSLTETPVNQVGIYAQNLISFTSKIKALAGIRYSYHDTRTFNTRFDSNPNINPTKKHDESFSPRFALIFQPNKEHSIFVSYSTSFQINTALDKNDNMLKPSTIKQYEAGIKNNLLKDKLFANLTFYKIDDDNLLQTDINNPGRSELAGATTSKGFEFDLVAYPTKEISIIGGYSFNERKYTKSTNYEVGSLVRYNPKHTANLSLNYNFKQGKLKGLYLGFINSFIGERFAGRSTRVYRENDSFKLIPLKAYYQLDATLGYNIKKFSVRTKLSNIFNELNYNIHDDNSLNPIAPRNYTVSVSYNF